jgi:hypothetical protein
MPLLYNSDYPDIDTNRLNKAKKRINKSSLVQYTKLKQVQSSIQPTKAEMKSYFLQITTFLNQLYQQFRIILNSGNLPNPNLQFELANKITQEFTPLLVQFSTEFNLKINPYYNYFSPQQNELIKQDIINIITILEEILFGNYGEQINNFVEITRQQLNLLIESVTKYSPLKINIKPSESGLFEKVEGGYIGGSHHAFYPETRFL